MGRMGAVVIQQQKREIVARALARLALVTKAGRTDDIELLVDECWRDWLPEADAAIGALDTSAP